MVGAGNASPARGYFRRLAPDGSAATGVRSLPIPPKTIATVAGGFLAAGGEPFDGRLYLQRYDANGDEQTPAFQVRNALPYYVYGAKMAPSPDERYMVVWYEEICSPYPPLLCYSNGGHGSTFDGTGDPLSNTFELPLLPHETETSVASTGNDSFVVSAAEYQSDGSSVGRRIDGSGTPLGNPFFFDGAQTIERLAGGDLVAVWTQRGYPNDRLFTRRYRATGEPVSPVFEIYACHDAEWCFMRRAFSIAPGPYGDFLVVWRSEEASDFDQVNAQWFSPAMDPGPVTLVADVQAGFFLVGSGAPEAHPASGNRFLVAWPDRSGVFGRFVATPVIFADGFESGDTTAWTNAVP